MLQAKYIPFIDTSLDDFCKRMIQDQDRENFSKYYQNHEQKITALENDAQKKRWHALYTKAMKSLENDHKAWANDINFFLTDLFFLDKSYDQERREVRVFLERYGVYKEFENSSGAKVAQRPKIEEQAAWKNVKTHVAKVAEKVGNWFKIIRTEMTT